MLSDKLDTQALLAAWLPDDQWRPIPPLADRDAWQRVQQQPMQRHWCELILTQADKLLGQPWPHLSATEYAQFARTGDRKGYEQPYFDRRRRLGVWTLAHGLSPQERWLDAAIDALWSICEESNWVIPAHARRKPGEELPDVNHPIVDLFAAETGMVLAEAWRLLGPQLEKRGAPIAGRIRQEIIHRVIAPFETLEFGWMDGHNNWTSWCCYNILGAGMHVLHDDIPRQVALAQRAMACLDRYIAKAPDDGGSDEGITYWNVGHLMLAGCLDLLHARTTGRLSIFDHPKIKAMARYVLVAHLHDQWFTNFADGSARAQLRNPMILRFGEQTGQPLVRQFALQAELDAIRKGQPLPSHTGMSLNAWARQLFWMPASIDDNPLPVMTHHWLDHLQIMTARSRPATDRGLALVIKGGHNAENHNHNDIGQFILYLDGQPGIIDAGVGVYTRDTFRRETRYQIWCIRASGHNPPVVNGVEQQPGRDFHASEVATTNTDAQARMRLNLATAYPPEARLRSLVRTATLDRSPIEQVVVRDEYELQENAGLFELTLLSQAQPVVDEPGQVRITLAGRPLLLSFDPASLSCELSHRTLTQEADGPMFATWGATIHQIKLTHRATSSRGAYEMRFAPALK